MFDIENSLGFLLSKCHQKAVSIFKKKLEAYNLTPPQFTAMAFLWKKDGINQIHLGELMDVDRTTISGILDRLEKIDMIERLPSPIDRRATIVVVTEKGRNLEKELTLAALEFNKSLARKFTQEELVDLIAKLKKIKFE